MTQPPAGTALVEPQTGRAVALQGRTSRGLSARTRRVRDVLERALRLRIVQFVALGGIAFAVSAHRNPGDTVRVPRGYLEARRLLMAQKLGIERLSPAQQIEVDRRSVEDAVLYREAQRLGLDRDDPIIAQHLIQKTLLLAEDLAGASGPVSDRELRAYFEATRARRVRAAHLSFVYAFFSSEARAEAAKVELEARPAAATRTPPNLGEASPLERTVDSTRSGVAAAYGEDFAATLEAAPPGVWLGPLRSRYGFHVVRLIEREGSRPATFEEVRASLALEYAIARRDRAVAEFLKQAFERYRVEAEAGAPNDYRPTHRLAVRTAPSAED